MAQYKVPQDVEADDKLLGPFNFRQFVYLLIAGGLVGIAVGLFQLLPLLAIIPVPFILFFLALALPLRKDQPMETYLSALLSFYTKPRTRTWEPGQKENTIIIMAPKIEKESLARDITGEEATHRLSFLADIVDSEGRAIKMGSNLPSNPVNSSVSAEIMEEANLATDIYETTHFDNLGDTIVQDEMNRHQDVINEMRAAIIKSNEGNTILKHSNVDAATNMRFKEEKKEEDTMVTLEPDVEQRVEKSVEKPVEEDVEKEQTPQTAQKSSIIELANNPDFSVATIAKEANRINQKEEGEVFISLH